jgi:hypothetical protein
MRDLAVMDESVIAAKQWVDLMIAGDALGAWPLTHADYKQAMLKRWLEAYPELEATIRRIGLDAFTADSKPGRWLCWEFFREMHATMSCDTSDWVWLPHGAPVAPSREAIWFMAPAVVELLEDRLRDPSEDDELQTVRLVKEHAMRFVMEHTPDGWLFCGQPTATKAMLNAA